jgi:methionyl-tRNA synthetase
MNNHKYITTTLPYINSKPHIGHALEFIQADALARWFRSQGKDVFFNVGVDEHGSKVHKQAVELGIDTQAYCDEQAASWIEFCSKFGISYDNFYRTSSEFHKARVQSFWKKCVERGDIYKGTYTGMYCVGCESKKLEKDLINGKCPDHDTVPETLDEVNWFFRLSKYKDTLLENAHREKFLYPSFKSTELVNLIEECEDISISRDRKIVPWGIQVPDDDTQTIYVWFEALLNYIFALDGATEFDDFWRESVQLCGPDNIRFQGCIFQAFLLSAGLSPTDKLLVHGTVTGPDGTKMSKTKGNVIDPIDQLDKFGVDAVRHYALGGISTFYNSAWSEKDLITLANDDLADNYGNLFARVMHLRNKNDYTGSDKKTKAFCKTVNTLYERAAAFWNDLHISNAIGVIGEILDFGNKYINDREPWKNPETERETLDNLFYLLEKVTILQAPVTPTICEEASRALQDNRKVILFQKIKLETNG